MTEAEDESLGRLPEVLLGKIVARIPFPQVLRLRELSSEWKSMFPRVASQVGVRWPEYFPAFISMQNSRSRVQMYDARMDLVMNIQGVPVEAGDKDLTGFGTLVAAVDFNLGRGQELLTIVATVVNLFTRQTRTLVYPSYPRTVQRRFHSRPILVPFETDHYELITWFYDFNNEGPSPIRMNVLVYNSFSGTWIEKSFDSYHITEQCHATYFDGSVYYVRVHQDEETEAIVVRLNVRNGATDESTVPLEVNDKIFGKWADAFVVRCGPRIIVAMFEGSLMSRRFQVNLFELHTDCFALVKLSTYSVCTSQSYRGYDHYIINVVASSSCVYILQLENPIVTTFDVNSKTWSSNPVPQQFISPDLGQNIFVFEPGLYLSLEP